jgi:hypothetical protein
MVSSKFWDFFILSKLDAKIMVRRIFFLKKDI